MQWEEPWPWKKTGYYSSSSVYYPKVCEIPSAPVSSALKEKVVKISPRIAHEPEV